MKSAEKKLVVHIGLHKTGTTSVQNFFSESRDSISASGLYYPTTGCAQHEGAHHNIYRNYTRNSDEKARFKPNLGGEEQLLEEIKSTDKDVLLSSEGFWVLARDEPEQFKDFISVLSRYRKLLIVVTWRNAAEYCESIYFQAAKFKQMVGIDQAARWFSAMPAEFKKVVTFVSSELNIETCIVQYSSDMIAVFSQMISDVLGIRIEATRNLQGYRGLSLSPAQKILAAHLSLSRVRLDDEAYKAVMKALGDGVSAPEAGKGGSILPESLQKKLLDLSVDGLREVLKENSRAFLYPAVLADDFDVRPAMLGDGRIFSFPKLSSELESI